MTYYINVYDVGRADGGPEAGEFIKTIGTAATLEEAIAIQDAYEACKAWSASGVTRLRSGGSLKASIDTERPSYE